MITTLLLIFLCPPAEEGQEKKIRTLSPGEKRVEIILPVTTKKEHRCCVLELPETRIASVILGWREEDLSLEKKAGRIFLSLLRKAKGSLHVVGGSGTLYRFHLRPPEEGEKPDDLVRLLPPPGRSRHRIPSIELLRSMKTGTVLPGVRRSPGKTLLLKNGKTSLRLIARHDAPHHTGYLLLCRNLLPRPARIKPQSFDAEGLLLIGADRWEVPPHSQTRLYLVFQK